MARAFDNASSQYCETDNTSISAYPFALVAWFLSDDDSAAQCVLWVGDKDASNSYHELCLRGNLANDPIQAASFTSYAASTTGYSTNTWHHGVAIFVSATDRRVLLDAGGKGTNSSSVAVGTPDRTAVGRRADSSPMGYMSGQVCEAAIYDLSVWSGATDSDKADEFERVAVPALAAGASPLSIPLGLVQYYPMIRDEDQDIVGGHDLTAYNTPTVATHAPGVFGRAPIFVAPPSTGVSDLSVSVSESISVAESVTVTLPNALAPSASDSISVAESVGRVLESFIAVSDAAAVAESVTVSVQATTTPEIDVSDAIAVAESIGRELINYISVSDAIAVAESVGRALISHVNVSDAVAVAESIGRLLTSFVDVSDSISVAESVTVSVGAAGAYEISVSDTVAVAESTTADVSDPQVSVSDTVSVGESTGVSIITGYSISVSDAVAVAESVTATISDLALSVSEAVSVAETVGRVLISYIGVSDAVAVADSPSVSVEVPGADLNISTSDSISVSDTAVIAVFLAATAPGLRVASSGIGAIRGTPQIIGTVRTAGTDGPLIRNTDETG